MRALVALLLIFGLLGLSAAGAIQNWDEQRVYKYQNSFRHPFFLGSYLNVILNSVCSSCLVRTNLRVIFRKDSEEAAFLATPTAFHRSDLVFLLLTIFPNSWWNESASLGPRRFSCYQRRRVAFDPRRSEQKGLRLEYESMISWPPDVEMAGSYTRPIRSVQPVEFGEWEVEVEFAIGTQPRRGADGMAVWYTADRMTEGPVFGNKDLWKGLAVIFDTFDNDGRVRSALPSSYPSPNRRLIAPFLPSSATNLQSTSS